MLIFLTKNWLKILYLIEKHNAINVYIEKKGENVNYSLLTI